MPRRRRLNLDQVLSLIEQEDEQDVVAVVIESPDVRALTDEDSGDEDATFAGPSNLNSHQLTAPAEIIRPRVEESVSSDDESDESGPQPSQQTPKRRRIDICWLLSRRQLAEIF